MGGRHQLLLPTLMVDIAIVVMILADRTSGFYNKLTVHGRQGPYQYLPSWPESHSNSSPDSDREGHTKKGLLGQPCFAKGDYDYWYYHEGCPEKYVDGAFPAGEDFVYDPEEDESLVGKPCITHEYETYNANYYDECPEDYVFNDNDFHNVYPANKTATNQFHRDREGHTKKGLLGQPCFAKGDYDYWYYHEGCPEKYVDGAFPAGEDFVYDPEEDESLVGKPCITADYNNYNINYHEDCPEDPVFHDKDYYNIYHANKTASSQL